VYRIVENVLKNDTIKNSSGSNLLLCLQGIESMDIKENKDRVARGDHTKMHREGFLAS
jgi:hypothetical protein